MQEELGPHLGLYCGSTLAVLVNMLEGPGILTVTAHRGFKFLVYNIAAITLALNALRSDIDLASLCIKVLLGFCFHNKEVSSILNICSGK